MWVIVADDIFCSCLSLISWLWYLSDLADGNVAVQFESGYFVETLVEGDKLGVTPHTIRVSPVEGGELLAVDSAHSNIVRITPPLSECMFFSCCPQFNAYMVLFKYFCAHLVGLLYGMKSVGLSEEWP